MPKVRRTCVKCGKLFWTVPCKDEEGNWHTSNKCQRCKNRERQEEQRKKKGEVRIRVIAEKVNLKREIDQLIWLENRHPKLVDKIRGKEINGKKKENPLSLKETKRKLRDELFKYSLGYKGLRQFSLEEIKNIALFNWRKRVKKTFK